jgi:3-oxoacyl-[acyl-carrier-protein] synthase II
VHILPVTSTNAFTPFPLPGTRRKSGAARAAAAGTAPSRETDPKKRVVITGMGLCSVFGNDVDVFYDKLLAGTSGIDLITRFDASKFPTKFAGQIKDFSVDGEIDGKNARRLDDCLKYGLVAGKKALRMAGLEGEGLEGVRRCARSRVCIGCSQ